MYAWAVATHNINNNTSNSSNSSTTILPQH